MATSTEFLNAGIRVLATNLRARLARRQNLSADYPGLLQIAIRENDV
jgi:hypothetical protein